MLAYCLLHYKNIEVTIGCVESIIANNRFFKDYRIIIYDNGSSDGTGEVLKRKYREEDNIIVLSNNTNLGFARGNNEAYQYAKKTLKCDIIVVMNSDIIVDESFSVKSIRKEIIKTNADILAPNIKNIDGYYQNPLAEKRYTALQTLESIIKNHILVTILKLPKVGKKYYNKYIIKKSKNLLKKQTKPKFIKENIIPHGACIIYSNNWVKNENIAFVPITFLYGEEEILYEYITYRNYKIVFDPNLNVLHLGKATLKKEFKDGRRVLSFFLKNQNRSLYKLLRIKLVGIKNNG